MRAPTTLVIAVALALAPLTVRADSGLITLESDHSAEDTTARLQSAIEARGFKVFTELDHAAAATEAELEMPYSTVVVFGNPKLGTPAFVQTPELAIDLPLKALVWEDSDGNVFLSYNSSAYIFETIYERHGQPYPPEMVQTLEDGLAGMMQEAAGG